MYHTSDSMWAITFQKDCLVCPSFVQTFVVTPTKFGVIDHVSGISHMTKRSWSFSLYVYVCTLEYLFDVVILLQPSCISQSGVLIVSRVKYLSHMVVHWLPLTKLPRSKNVHTVLMWLPEVYYCCQQSEYPCTQPAMHIRMQFRFTFFGLHLQVLR